MVITNARRSELVWQLSDASARGKAHVDNSLPNQDAVQVVTSANGDIACAVVSDGAGTAARSAEGSRAVADHVAVKMCEFGRRYRDSPIELEAVREELEFQIALVRRRLDPQETNLREFHCTFVMWLGTPTGAVVAQVGDSAAIASRFAWVNEPNGQHADFFPDGGYRLYEVERGEYSNETHFITEPDWQSHLRINLLPADIDAVVLMTDGAMDIAMLNGKVFRGFLSNLVGKLLATPSVSDRQETIHAWLDDRQTYGVTGDDKTLFVAVRQQRRAFAGHPVYLEPPHGTSPQTPPASTPKVPAASTPSGSGTRSTSVQVPPRPPPIPTPRRAPGGVTLVQVLTALIALQFVVIAFLAGLVAFRGATDKRTSVPAECDSGPPQTVRPGHTVVPHSPTPTPAATAAPPLESLPSNEKAAIAAPTVTTAPVTTAAEPPANRTTGRAVDTSSSIRLQAYPKSPVLGADGIGEVELRWMQGPSLRLAKIDFDARSVKLLDENASCIRGVTVLEESNSVCVLRVRGAPGAKPLRVDMKFVDSTGKTVLQPISFAPGGVNRP